MTREEAIKILAVLKAAYPNFYKNMTKEEAKGTVNVWASQFVAFPYSAVSIAVQKLISTKTFPPTVSEVKERIRSLYWEAEGLLRNHTLATKGEEVTHWDKGVPTKRVIYWDKKYILDPTMLQAVKEIIKVCEPLITQQRIEPSLTDLMTGYSGYLEGSDTKKIGGE